MFSSKKNILWLRMCVCGVFVERRRFLIIFNISKKSIVFGSDLRTLIIILKPKGLSVIRLIYACSCIRDVNQWSSRPSRSRCRFDSAGNHYKKTSQKYHESCHLLKLLQLAKASGQMRIWGRCWRRLQRILRKPQGNRGSAIWNPSGFALRMNFQSSNIVTLTHFWKWI